MIKRVDCKHAEGDKHDCSVVRAAERFLPRATSVADAATTTPWLWNQIFCAEMDRLMVEAGYRTRRPR